MTMPSESPYAVEIRMRSVTTQGERSGIQRLAPSADMEAAVSSILAAAPQHGAHVESSVQERHESGLERYRAEAALGGARPHYYDGFPPDVSEIIRVFLVSIGTADGLHKFLESAKTLLAVLTKPAAVPVVTRVTVGDVAVEVGHVSDLDAALDAAARAAEIERHRAERPAAVQSPGEGPKRLIPVDAPKRLLDDG